MGRTWRLDVDVEKLCATLEDENDDSDEIERVSRMIRDEQIRWYQQVKGLQQDGVVGAMTLIQMSNDLDAGVPRLVPGRNTVIAPVGPQQPAQPRSG